jgi:hypothetical protein
MRKKHKNMMKGEENRERERERERQFQIGD